MGDSSRRTWNCVGGCVPDNKGFTHNLAAVVDARRRALQPAKGAQVRHLYFGTGYGRVLFVGHLSGNGAGAR